MRGDHVLARGPLEDGEASVLGGYQCGAAVLVLNKLRGRKMPRAAQLIGLDQSGHAAFDGLRDNDLLHQRMASAASDLGAETQHIVLVGEDYGAIHGGEA